MQPKTNWDQDGGDAGDEQAQTTDPFPAPVFGCSTSVHLGQKVAVEVGSKDLSLEVGRPDEFAVL